MLFKATMFMPDANANLYMMQLSQQTTQTRANDANKYGLTGEFAPHLTKSQRKAVLKWRRDMPKRMEYWKLLEIFKQRMEREKKNYKNTRQPKTRDNIGTEKCFIQTWPT